MEPLGLGPRYRAHVYINYTKPRKINPPSGAGDRFPALMAGTHFPQILPGINPQVVIIVPRKLDGVPAYTLRGDRLRRGLENHQRSGSLLRRLSRMPSTVSPLLFAHRARTSIPQVCKPIVRNMPIRPRN